MKITLSGYGRMGHEVEKVAEERGHEIIYRIDQPGDWEKGAEIISKSDAVIDFSLPSTAVDNINNCFRFNLPVISGTTGWDDHREKLIRKCLSEGKALFFAPNFSIGVNILFEINRKLAGIMDNRPEYKAVIRETHHIHKLDAPSGTAITLADGIIDNIESLNKWANNQTDDPASLQVLSDRIGEITGIHEVIYDSDIDTLSLKHEAKSRKGFALGAVIAAEWLQGKKGYYEMKDLLSL